MHFKKNILSLAVYGAAAGLVPAAFAQDQAQTVDEIVVYGLKASVQSAQDVKRNADTVKDVITASDIGALPDKSVTESLQRVPGVTIAHFASSSDLKHFADEGTGVLVRGLDRVRSEINGRDAFSANPYGGLSYEDFPPELLGAVEVVKNQTADLISGGIAGTVNLQTRKPFDSKERLIAFSAKANYGDFREEVTPSFSGLFSDRWETSAGEFGFLVSASKSELETRGDGVGMGNYHPRGTDTTPNASWDIWGTSVGPGKVEGAYDGPCVPNALGWMPECGGVAANVVSASDAYHSPYDGKAVQGQADGTTVYTPANYVMTSAENDRDRQGVTTSLQWQNADETVVATLEHINSKATLETRERVISSGDRGFIAGTGGAVDWSGDDAHPLTIDGNGFLTSGIGKNTDVNFPVQFRSRYNYVEDTVKDTSFNLKLTPTEKLTVSFDVQHVNSEQTVHNYSLAAQIRGDQTAAVAPYFLDLRGSTPEITYLSDRVSNPTQAAEPDEFLGSGIEDEVYSEAKLNAFKVDVGYKLDGIFTGIKSGVYYSDKELSIGDTAYSNWVALGTPWVQSARLGASTVSAPQLFERVSFSDYYHGEVLQGANNSFLFPKMDMAKNFGDTLRSGCGTWSAVGNANDGSGECAKEYRDLNNRADGPFAAQDLSSTEEKRTEFYVRGDFEFADLSVPIKGNLGLRYVNYQLESTGYLSLPSQTVRGTPGESLYNVMQTKYPALFALAAGGEVINSSGLTLNGVQSTVDGTDYNTVLPSLNLAFSLSEDVVMRFGASKGLFYPNLLQTRNTMLLGLDYTKVLQDPSKAQDEATNPVVDIKDIEISATTQNPYLKPENAINLDLSTEWYFAKAGSLTVGLFHKKLDNIIRNRGINFDIDFAGNTYPVSGYGPDNTGSGTIKGAEVSYSQFYDFLPGAWSGLGLQLNFTYINQDGLESPESTDGNVRFNADGTPIVDKRNSFRAFSGLPLQGYSDKNFNIVGMYEYNDISFRLAYTWRSEYLSTQRESEEFVPAYAKASGQLDTSLYYTINDNWKVGIEGTNLLNTDTQTQYQLNQAGAKTDAFSFTTDRRYALSVRATF